MSKILLQTSKNKPSQTHIDSLMEYAQGWKYEHYDDAEIIEFFVKNPIPGFENISNRFYEIRRGEHRADLFRYYYLYVNGGFFIDLDLAPTCNLDDVVQSYSFVSAELKAWDNGVVGVTNRSRLFNGYLYAEKNHPIIFQALSHLYNLDLQDLGPLDGSFDRRYHVVCEFLYNAMIANKNNNIKIYKEIVGPEATINDGQKILGIHRNVPKEPFAITNNKTPVLFFCELTSSTGFNSGIQRHVKQMAKAMLENGVNLIPVKLNRGNTLEIISDKELENMANHNGPRVDQWQYKRFLNIYNIDHYVRNAEYMVYAELPLLDGRQRFRAIVKQARRSRIKIVSVFHDAVAVVLNKVYSQRSSSNFMVYMQDLSYSNILMHVSDSSMADYHRLMGKARTNQRSIVLKSPHNIDPDKYFKPKENKTKNINILSVISFEKRKNHLALIEAFDKARNKLSEDGYTLNLRIVSAYRGDEQYYNEVIRLASKFGVEVSMGIREEELIAAYSSCDFTIYPSLYEGFGLPIVESLQMSRPVACSNTSSMKEVAELGGCYVFNPNDINDMASAIIEMSSNKELIKTLNEEIKNITPYSWKSYAKDFVKIMTGGVPQKPWKEIEDK